MRKIKNYLGAIALATAALGAFAFSPQNPDPNQTLFANQNGTWVPLEEGEQYRCATAPTICVAQFEDDDSSKQMTYSEQGRFSQ